MGISNGENIYKWGMFGMFHCHALPKKTSAIGACCIRPFRSESGSYPAEKSPIFFRPKSDSAFGFFWIWLKILLLSDTTDS